MVTIIEGGHFYSNVGMTEKAGQGWGLAENIKNNAEAKTMLFIDEVHMESGFEDPSKIIPVNIDFSSPLMGLSDEVISLIEKINKNSNVTVDVPILNMRPDYITFEGDMAKYTNEVLDILFKLSKRQGKPRKKTNGEIFTSGGKIIQSDEKPTCLGYDIGLTYLKDIVLKADSAVNILPSEYKLEQDLLNKVYRKVNSGFKLSQIYI